MRTIWIWMEFGAFGSAARVVCSTLRCASAGAEKLRAYLMYLNGHGANKPADEPFSVVVMGHQRFFGPTSHCRTGHLKQRPV